MTPNADRALAYGRVVKTLDDLGPTKLLPDEQETIRSAADALLFEEDGYEALTEVEDLAERLVEAERWTPERARALVDDVAACGYAAGMRSIRDTYDVPDETPSPVRMWALMVGVVVLALVLWLVLPDSPVTVAILAVVVLATVFFGVSRVLASRQLNRPPGRNQTPPPSAG